MKIVEDKKYTFPTLLRNPLVFKTDKGTILKRSDIDFFLAYHQLKQFGFATYQGQFVLNLAKHVHRKISADTDLDRNNNIGLVRSINGRCIRNRFGYDLIKELSVVTSAKHCNYFNRVIRNLKKRRYGK